MDADLWFRWCMECFLAEVERYQQLKWTSTEPFRMQKVLLIVDNAAVHSPLIEELADFSNYIEILFLPPNTTCLIQPMDQTVIRSFKCRYVKELMDQVVKSENIDKFIKGFSIKKAVPLISTAWNSIPASTMKNSWNKLLNGIDDFVSKSAESLPKLDQQLQDLSKKLNLPLDHFLTDVDEDNCDLLTLTKEEIELYKPSTEQSDAIGRLVNSLAETEATTELQNFEFIDKEDHFSEVSQSISSSRTSGETIPVGLQNACLNLVNDCTNFLNSCSNVKIHVDFIGGKIK